MLHWCSKVAAVVYDHGLFEIAIGYIVIVYIAIVYIAIVYIVIIILWLFRLLLSIAIELDRRCPTCAQGLHTTIFHIWSGPQATGIVFIALNVSAELSGI